MIIEPRHDKSYVIQINPMIIEPGHGKNLGLSNNAVIIRECPACTSVQ